MKRTSFEAMFILLGLLSLLGCGETASPVSGKTTGEGGRLILVVKSTPATTSATYAQIERYRVSVSADDMAEPIVAEFSGDADSGVIEGIPVGAHRRVTVEAINPTAQVFQAGEAEDVEVRGGETAEANVELESVPIVVNVKTGSRVENTRLLFRILSEPGEPVVLDEGASDEGKELIDADSSLPEVFPDVSTGLATFKPTLMGTGEYTFTVRNARTGRASTLQVKLIDGTKRKGAPLFSFSGMTVFGRDGR